MAMADGIEIYKILDDLRHIKLPKNVRARVLELQSRFKVGWISIDDQVWLRRLYNRRATQIKELHASYESVRMTNAKQRRGSARDRLLKARARRLTRLRMDDAARKVADELEQLERESKDFGF